MLLANRLLDKQVGLLANERSPLGSAFGLGFQTASGVSGAELASLVVGLGAICLVSAMQLASCGI